MYRAKRSGGRTGRYLEAIDGPPVRASRPRVRTRDCHPTTFSTSEVTPSPRSAGLRGFNAELQTYSLGAHRDLGESVDEEGHHKKAGAADHCRYGRDFTSRTKAATTPVASASRQTEARIAWSARLARSRSLSTATSPLCQLEPGWPTDRAPADVMRDRLDRALGYARLVNR